jgi:hypothetical protein
MARGELSVEVDGLMETLKAVQEVEAALRPAVNGELRDAAGRSAEELARELVSSASSSGVPVAPLVARSIRVKRDRLPVVSIGGPMRVGSGGGTASDLVWGSEQGPKGEVNHFAVPPSAGYWIAPAVERYGAKALDNFRRAVLEIFKRYGLA